MDFTAVNLFSSYMIALGAIHASASREIGYVGWSNATHTSPT
jgi:hypothetical protein